jgi:Protein of unknown function (DUF2833)
MRYVKTTVRRARIDDAFKLAANLRAEDLIEIRSAHNDRPPYKSLIDGIVLSGDECWTIEANSGEVIAIFGAAKAGDTVGCVWLLGSAKIKQIQREFLRHSKFWVDKMHERYPILANVVYAENTVHIKWLKWLGFKFIRKIDKYGNFGLPFYEFVRVKI